MNHSLGQYFPARWGLCPLLLLVFTCGGGETEQGPSVDPGPAPGTLEQLAPLRIARSLHSATLLQDGTILIAGGDPIPGGGPIATAERYDPAAGGSVLTGSLAVGREGHTATLLPSGKVLIVGGWGSGERSSRSAELYDPVSGQFQTAAQPLEPHSDHAAILLGSGRVLILGGDTSGVGQTPTADAELYDPATGRFSRTGSMRTPRRPYGVVALADGRVLVPGGTTTGKQVVATAEIYDPATGRFTATGSMTTPRQKHSAARLADGRVLIVGGMSGNQDASILASSEIYDPASGAFVAGPAMRGTHYKCVALPLSTGAVLVVGGGPILVERYDAEPNGFRAVQGAAGLLRFFPATVALPSGDVIISGGYSSGGSQTGVWRYQP